MAFGDVVKSAYSGTGSNINSLDLGSTPASGNLLVFCSGNPSNSATLTTAPSGFTALQTCTTGNLRGGFWYKVSDGTEQTAGVTWSAGNGRSWYGEFDFGGYTLVTPVVTAEDNTNISATVTSQGLGSVTPANATNLWVGMVAIDLESNAATSPTWSDSISSVRNPSGSFAGAAVGKKLNIAASAFAPTFSHSGTTDEMWGASAVFEYVAAGAPIPIFHRYYSQMRNN